MGDCPRRHVSPDSIPIQGVDLDPSGQDSNGHRVGTAGKYEFLMMSRNIRTGIKFVAGDGSELLKPCKSINDSGRNPR